MKSKKIGGVRLDFLKGLKNRKGASGATIGAIVVLTLAFIVASVSYIMPAFAQVPNPELPSSCGIDIALILDNSGSINDTELTAVKNAAKDFVDAFLPLTPTNIAVVKFATNGYLVLDYNNDATTIKAAIDSISTTTSYASYTNWDDGLKEAQDEFDNSAKPDLYVFISDGNPNKYGDPATPSGAGQDPTNALAAAVTRADAIKTAGVRIVALGIGNDLNVSNLEAISSVDAVITSNFDTLADDLADLANELCGGTVIVKKLVNGDEASGWHFDLTGASSTSNPANGDTDVDGVVIFDVDVDTSVNVDLTETLESGYYFDSASCDDGQSGAGLNGAVTNILVEKNGIVNCVFNNEPCVCGDGQLGCDEECDDGNNDDGDCCSAECTFEAYSTPCEADDSLCTVDHCDGAGTCTYLNDLDCSDENECTIDTCNPITGCDHPPVDCDDENACTIDTCNILSGCVNTPDDSYCDDGLWCNGEEICDVLLGCQAGTAPNCDDSVDCTTDECDEAADSCVNTPDDSYCDDGLWCNGEETCDALLDCQSGTAVDCSDSLFCTVNERCDEATDQCLTDPRDCSANDITEIMTCNNNPDDNPFTWDSRDSFTSVCDENEDECTTGDGTIDHECSIQDCGAECEEDSDCENHCEGLIFKYDGLCLGDCSCDYTEMSCSDQISCTVDACDDVEGCSHTPDDALCNDDNMCTLDICELDGCTHEPIDTEAPVTTKTLYPADDGSGCFVKDIVDCHDDEEDVLPEEVELTNGCEYVKAGTQIVLESEDDFTDVVQLHWIVWYKVNPEDEWTIDQEGVTPIGEGEIYNESVIINLDKDSYHLIEYWGVDECGVEEDHHYELDIVDSQGPVAEKTIGEPKDPWTPGENGDPVSYFYPDETANCWAEEGGIECWEATTLTPILMECDDPEPHPVGEKMVCFNVDVDGEDETKEYCEEYGGFYHWNDDYIDGGVCCRLLGKRKDNDKFDGWDFFGYKDKCDEVQDIECYNSRKLIYFLEETEHNLQYYCVDKLGNVGEIDEEKFKVEGNKFEVPLYKKWNLISVPFTLLDDSPETVFSKVFYDGEQIPYEEIGNYIDTVLTYDPEHVICGLDWCVWKPGVGGTLDSIKPGWGYWVLVKDKPEDGCDYGWFKKFWDKDEDPLWIVIGGSLFSPAQTPPSRQLQSGWNLIGYYGNNWEDYDWGDFDFMCGDAYQFPDKLLYGSQTYCALNSLIDTQEGYPRWSSLWSYVNCGNHYTNWLGLNSCINPSQYIVQDKMYAGRGYWIELDVSDIYAPATTCIWNDDFQCVWTGGMI